MTDTTTIGGFDFVIPGKPSEANLWYALLGIRTAWPDAVFHGISGRVRPIGGIVDALSDGRELFIYRDSAAWEAWQKDGGTPENAGTMIHLLGGGELSTTLVADAQHSETGRICHEVQVALLAHHGRRYFDPLESLSGGSGEI